MLFPQERNPPMPFPQEPFPQERDPPMPFPQERDPPIVNY